MMANQDVQADAVPYITKRVRQEEDNCVGLMAREERPRAGAEAELQRKGELLAEVSHELRNPLTSIAGWVRLLRSGTLDAPASERAFDIIERNIEAQIRLIEDLLDTSRVYSGKLSLRIQEIDLRGVVGASVDIMQPAARSKGIYLNTILPAVPAKVSGDPHRLQQVFLNLLANSVKFTAHGGAVHVELACADAECRIKVVDTGRGIEPEFLSLAFDRYSQAESSDGGLGLGLAIVRQIVELHGGRVTAHSHGAREGATFVVRLPLNLTR